MEWFNDVRAKQINLDAYILDNHDNLTMENTMYERFLAKLVELGELANETRCFKYWSNKPSSEKDIVLDEFVDVLHFYASILNGLKVDYFEDEGLIVEHRPTILFLKLFVASSSMLLAMEHKAASIKDIAFEWFNLYMSLADSLGFTEQDIIDAYDRKNKVNYERQDNGY